MITFDLRCGNGHGFEGWFESREAFERQLAASMISCPLCDSKTIEKRPSAVAIHIPDSGEGKAVHKGAQPEPPKPAAFFRELAEFVRTNFEDVGAGFAREAIKMKEGEAEPRAIRGTTTPAEEETLADEGVEFLKVALPKYDA